MTKKTTGKSERSNAGWLLFFYRVPSRPVSTRMKIWRKLSRAGAVQLKGAVYVLPFSDEHHEFLQWLVAEIAEMKGEAAFVTIEKVDTMKDDEIIGLFNRQRADEYRAVGKTLDDFERKLGSIQKGARRQHIKGIADQFGKLEKEFEAVRRIDFFSSGPGRAFQQRLEDLRAALRATEGEEAGQEKPVVIVEKAADRYQGRVWVTRKRPFIDRMASAWLIKKFIDPKAFFDFSDEKDLGKKNLQSVAFDVRGGEFTHAGDLCTFEVLVKSFGLRDRTLKKIGQIVHDLDMKDDKYRTEEAAGLEDILSGIRKTAKNDIDALEKGMAVFEMLYTAKS